MEPWTRCRLIDVAPALAHRVPEVRAQELRNLWVATVRRPAGPWEGPPAVPGLGTLVVDGLISRGVALDDFPSTALIWTGDVLPMSRRNDPHGHRWELLRPTRLALLDEPFVARARHWPEVTSALCGRLADLGTRLAIVHAISGLPRVEDRIVALLELLAEPFGEPSEDGATAIGVPLTHERIGSMIGARRPTVTLAAKRLRERNVVLRRSDGVWVLGAPGVRGDRSDAVRAAVHSLHTSALPDSVTGRFARTGAHALAG